MSQSRWIHFIAFFYLLILLMPISNVAHSIIFSIVMVTCGCMYPQYRYIEWDRLHKGLLGTIFSFLGCLFFISLFFDKSVINETLRYLSWVLPCMPLFLFSIYEDIESSWIWAAIVGGLVLSTPVIYEKWMYDVYRPGGFFVSPNNASLCLEYTFPLLVYGVLKRSNHVIRKFRKIAGIISLCMTTLALVYMASRGAIIGLTLGGISGLLLFLWRYLKRYSITVKLVVVTLIIGIFTSASYYLHDEFRRSYDYERVLLVESSYAMWKDHPLIGVGFSNWGESYQNVYILPEAKEPHLSQPHNTIAYFFSTTGIFGGISFLVLMGVTIVTLIRWYIKTGNSIYLIFLWVFLSVYIHGLFDSGITNKAAMREYCAYYGLLLAYIYNSSKHKG